MPQEHFNVVWNLVYVGFNGRPTIEHHLTQLAEVLRLLQSAGLKLKPSKCDLLKKEVVFLGHVVNGCGVSPNPKLISAVKDWKEPSTVYQV